jgi:hypothetical protein
MIRTYSELRRLRTFEDRYKYLALHGQVGGSTFGFERYLNQRFYTSSQWRNLRHQIIVRDNACDLGFPDHEIHDKLLIHHMNPMTVEQVVHGDADILDPEFLITVSHQTHNAIHYGDERLLPRQLVERVPGDTNLWKPRGARQ